MNTRNRRDLSTALIAFGASIPTALFLALMIFSSSWHQGVTSGQYSETGSYVTIGDAYYLNYWVCFGFAFVIINIVLLFIGIGLRLRSAK